MRGYIPGAIISLILIIVFFTVDSEIYNKVMPLQLIITLLVLHAMVFKYLIPEKKYGSYLLYILIFIICVYFSLPEYTYKQAKTKVENDYGLVDVSFEHAPFDPYGSWNPFESTWGYMFSGRDTNSDEAVSVLFVPHNGKMFKMDE